MLGVDAVFGLARDDVQAIDRVAVCADDLVFLDRFERRRVLGHSQRRSVDDEVGIGNLRLQRRADDHARTRVALRLIDAQSRRCGTNQLPARIGAGLAHELPVARQTRTAADTLAAAVFPCKAVGRFDDAERHLADADLVPLDVEFLGHHHRQGRPQALADLGLLGADDDRTIRIDLHEPAYRPCVVSLVGECRQADDQAAGDPGSNDQELTTGYLISLEDGTHDASPVISSAAR